MKTLAPSLVRVASIGTALVLLAPFTRAGTLLDLLRPSPELETIAVTDFTPAGHRLPAHSPANPLYYVAVSGGYCDLGGIMAGERPISRRQVNNTMLKVLAKQGLLPAPAGRTPDIILIWKWGTMNVATLSGPDPSYAPQVNEQTMLRFLGGEKLGINTNVNPLFADFELPPGVQHESSSATALRAAAHSNLFVVHIAAYGTKLDDRGQPVALWNTRISAPAYGFWLPDALPSMIVMAGSCIGRETAQPVWLRASEHFRAEVILGDLKAVDDPEHSDSAITNAGNAP